MSDWREEHPDYVRQTTRESSAEDAIRVLARAIVALAEPVWRYGDGHGAWVYQSIAEAAAQAGLPVVLGIPTPPSTLAMQLADRDGGFYCHYCERPLMGSPEVPHTNIDHVIPKARGGGNEISNLVLACAPCNSAKGTKSVAEFMATRQ